MDANYRAPAGFKTCKRCGDEKPKQEFLPHSWTCNACQKAKREASLERQRERNRQYIQDAQRFRWLMKNGCANEKNHSRAVAGDRLRAKFAFRYWCPPEEVLAEIDNRIKGETK